MILALLMSWYLLTTTFLAAMTMLALAALQGESTGNNRFGDSEVLNEVEEKFPNFCLASGGISCRSVQQRAEALKPPPCRETLFLSSELHL